MTDAPITLDHIAKLLQSYEFEFTKQEASEEIPFEQILVFLGEIDEEHPLILHIRLLNDLAMNGGAAPLDEDPESQWAKQLAFLHFFISLPIVLPKERLIDAGRLVLMINKVLPLPGFGLSEVDRIVFYQYTFLIKSHTVDSDLLLGILAMIVHLIDTNLPTFQEIANNKTFEQLIEESRDLNEEEDGN